MRKRVLLGLTVALLVLLAGCSGLADSEAGTENGSEDAPETLPDDAVDTHRDALRDAGSFNATRRVEFEANGTDSLVTGLQFVTRYQVDYENDRAIRRQSLLGETVRYTAGETTYQRRTLGDANASDATYRVTNHSDDDGDSLFDLDPVNTTEASGVDAVLSAENLTYTADGTTTVDGVTATRYVATGVGADRNASEFLGQTGVDNSSSGADGDAGEEGTESELGFDEPDSYRVANLTATVLVDDDGIVRRSTWSITLEERGGDAEVTLTFTYEVSDVGESEVEPPSWLDEARESEDEGFSFGDDGDGEDDGESYGDGESCGDPDVEGSLSVEETSDGSFDVTYENERMANATYVLVEENTTEQYGRKADLVYREGGSADLRGVEAGTTVDVVAVDDCGEKHAVDTVTVGDEES